MPRQLEGTSGVLAVLLVRGGDSSTSYDHVPSSSAWFVISALKSCSERGEIVLPGQLVIEMGRCPRNQGQQGRHDIRDEGPKFRVSIGHTGSSPAVVWDW